MKNDVVCAIISEYFKVIYVINTMNKLTHNMIGWGAGLAIGMTIGVSLKI